MTDPHEEATLLALGADLERTYERRFHNQTAYRNRVWQVLTEDYFQRIVGPAATVLDLGCGYGQFINNIGAAKKYAMDLNPRSRTSVASDVSFLEQDCSQRWPFEDATLDVVFTSNFLEHLPDKAALRRTLKEARRCLCARGKIICLGPNVRYLPGAYWDFWDHNVALSDRSIAEILELCGFRVERRIPRFLPFTMAEGPPAPLAFVRWYLRLPIAWPIFGHQFLVIAGGIG
jgi:SAM-dependent methyltransferase